MPLRVRWGTGDAQGHPVTPAKRTRLGVRAKATHQKESRMPEWKGIVARSFSPDEFETYCNGLTWLSWRPTFVVLHNTAIPSLAQVPNGFSDRHMQGFESYYRDDRKWSAG